MSKVLSRLLGVALIAIAPVVAAAPCVPGSLQDYFDLASVCEIGTTSFSDFYDVPGPAGATPIDPDLIQVTPTGPASNPGLLLTLNVAASGADFFDTVFHFIVTAGPGRSLNGARVTTSGASATEFGAVTVAENLCLDGLFLPLEPSGCSAVPVALLALVIEGLPDADESTTFAPSGFLDVFADFGIDAGPTGSGTAALVSGTLQFATTAAAVPEPQALPLLLLALTALAVFARRRQPQ